MSDRPSVLVVSSSMKTESRSERIALLAAVQLEAQGLAVRMVRLKDYPLPPFDDQACYRSEAYAKLHAMAEAADSLVFAAPVYNWSCCGELKKFVETVGSTPPDGSRCGAFFDKLVSFALAAGLPHSYMAAGPLMLSMMLDFKCVVNPQQAYLHGRHWTEGGELVEEGAQKIDSMVAMHAELAIRLQGRPRRPSWSV